jgi:hypothetical protein
MVYLRPTTNWGRRALDSSSFSEFFTRSLLRAFGGYRFTDAAIDEPLSQSITPDIGVT